MGLASTHFSEDQAQLDIMIQLGFSTLQMRRRIARSRCCVRNYVRDTMAHGSAKPTGRPRILIVNDRDERSVGLFARVVYCHGKQFQSVAELKDAVWDKIQPSYLESLTNSRNNRLFQVMQKFKEPNYY
uniref:HTH_Tnp_Tc3_1 domain-containing protein n=1 Tax=Caenorhabditis japonica TaxID=281687 RepID=A0A8R1IPF9_CAEJA